LTNIFIVIPKIHQLIIHQLPLAEDSIMQCVAVIYKQSST